MYHKWILLYLIFSYKILWTSRSPQWSLYHLSRRENAYKIIDISDSFTVFHHCTCRHLRFFSCVQPMLSHIKYKKNHCWDKYLLQVYRLTFANSTAPVTSVKSRLKICHTASLSRDCLYSEGCNLTTGMHPRWICCSSMRCQIHNWV